MDEEDAPKEVARYYSPDVNPTNLIPEAGLVQFMTGDHLSPPVVTGDAVQSPQRWAAITGERVVDLARKLDIEPGDVVLDLGNGIGAPGRDIAKALGCEIIGINITFAQLKTLGRLSVAANSTYRNVVNADMQSLPIADSSIDAIYSINAMYHAPSYKAVFDEAARTLKPGAKVGIDDWYLTAETTPETLTALRQKWMSPQGFHVADDVIAYAESIGLRLTTRDDFTEGLAEFLTDDAFGKVYDEKIASKIHAGFIELYGDTYEDYVPEHADIAVSQQRETVLYMGDLYRNGQAVYQQLIFEKVPLPDQD
jgi:ubiquinone/menaquinone biosynthesis C-methylase UbiE